MSKPHDQQASPEAASHLRPLGIDPSRWELSEETRAYIREIERAIVRPGDPRLNDPTLIGPAGPAIGLDGYGSQARPPAQGTEARSDEARLVAEMLAALKGVVRVADRATIEFDAARAAIARAEGHSIVEGDAS